VTLYTWPLQLVTMLDGRLRLHVDLESGWQPLGGRLVASKMLDLPQHTRRRMQSILESLVERRPWMDSWREVSAMPGGCQPSRDDFWPHAGELPWLAILNAIDFAC
jgi:hypothetical protein